MSLLSNLIRQKAARVTFEREETNLATGQLFYFNPGTVSSDAGVTIEWTAPSNGIAEIEIWGASGSGGLMCCCGTGIPGNPGAYAKRSVPVAAGDVVTGTVGRSCGNTETLCYRGRSESTCVCWLTDRSGAMCAQGGIGGTALCGNDAAISSFCGFVAAGFCGTPLASDGCGTICNYTNPSDIAIATGGDFNKDGGFSCATFFHCNWCCACSTYQHVKTSPGVFSQDGGIVTYNYGLEQGQSNAVGQNYHAFTSALNALSRQPSQGQPASFCWTAARACGAFTYHGCFPYLPHGVPGPSGTPCTDTRSHGLRGGHGAVRINFIGSE